MKTNGISAVILRGTGTVYKGKVSQIGCGNNCVNCELYPNSAACIEVDCFDVGLFDANSNEQIGEGTDCLYVEEINATCGQLLVTGTTFYRPYNLAADDTVDRNNNNGSVLVSRGKTTVQPTASGSSAAYTHITGAIVGSTDNSILYGTGVFSGVTGAVRLSGGVNMAVVGTVTFNCIFVLDLDDGTNDDNSVVVSTPAIAVSGRTVVKLAGVGNKYSSYVPVLECTENCVNCLDSANYNDAGCVVAPNCYDSDLIDVATGQKIGTGTDCLMPTMVGIPGCGTMLVSGTTIYKLTNVDGFIVSRGATTVQPVSPGSSDGFPSTQYKKDCYVIKNSATCQSQTCNDRNVCTQNTYQVKFDDDFTCAVGECVEWDNGCIAISFAEECTKQAQYEDGELIPCYAYGDKLDGGCKDAGKLDPDDEWISNSQKKYTHITGAIPGDSDNSILYGTGIYAGAKGSVRLSGAVDMSGAMSSITFNCIFVLDLIDDSNASSIYDIAYNTFVFTIVSVFVVQHIQKF